MKLKDQVCSLKLAKELKELGVKQESLFYWSYNDPTGKDDPAHGSYGEWELTQEPNLQENYVSAFTVAELGERLPESIQGEHGWIKIWFAKTMMGECRANLGEKHFEKAKTEANARAKMLIYLEKQEGG